ncbi:MAG: sugar-binding protein [Polaribacter sp.]|uniref:sugar-binding protein n=1 Tax=Polaribacter sp. TaxID=1920175 RepID=UPI003262F961
MKIYKVKYLKKSSENLIKDNPKKWKKANTLIDFYSPWDSKPIKKIEFKAVHNNEKIFFRFKVDDKDTYTHPSRDKNESINTSDRVELFFRTNQSLNPYYCLEIDTTSRIMDFKAYPNKKFDFNWNWPSEHIGVKSTKKDTYFVVEITISIQSLKELSLLNGNFIETGIYRAKYIKEKSDTYIPTWITWVDPTTPEPNFHTQNSFGLLELEDFIKNV